MKYQKPIKGAFQDWTVLLVVSHHRRDMFQRVLKAGGADVVVESLATLDRSLDARVNYLSIY